MLICFLSPWWNTSEVVRVQIFSVLSLVKMLLVYAVTTHIWVWWKGYGIKCIWDSSCAKGRAKSLDNANECVQRRETNIVKGLEGNVYKKRLRSLGSLSPEQRRLRGGIMMAVAPSGEWRGWALLSDDRAGPEGMAWSWVREGLGEH